MTTVTLDLKAVNVSDVINALRSNIVFFKVENNEVKVPAQFSAKAQAIIDELANRMPDLLPAQFHFMLNKYGFDDAITQLLPALKTENIDKYAMYKAYLEQARFYEFSKTLEMFNDIKDKFAAIDESLDFTVEQLKAMWLEASKV